MIAMKSTSVEDNNISINATASFKHVTKEPVTRDMHHLAYIYTEVPLLIVGR